MNKLTINNNIWKVVNGKFSLKLKKNVIITLTTVEKSKPENFPEASPESKRFPVPFYEDFEGECGNLKMK